MSHFNAAQLTSSCIHRANPSSFIIVGSVSEHKKTIQDASHTLNLSVASYFFAFVAFVDRHILQTRYMWECCENTKHLLQQICQECCAASNGKCEKHQKEISKKSSLRHVSNSLTVGLQTIKREQNGYKRIWNMSQQLQKIMESFNSYNKQKKIRKQSYHILQTKILHFKPTSSTK